MNYEQLAIDKRRFINMTLEQEAEVQRLIKDIDVTELMDMLKKHGNRYSRRILKFFRWFCKYVPIIIMFFHAYGIREFSQHPREMFNRFQMSTPAYREAKNRLSD